MKCECSEHLYSVINKNKNITILFSIKVYQDAESSQFDKIVNRYLNMTGWKLGFVGLASEESYIQSQATGST